MENKGFTLIELLTVIALMALLGTIITINFTGSLKKTNQQRCDEFVRELEDAACVYAELSSNKDRCNRNNCDPIKLNDLINQGLIEIKKDVCTGQDMNLNQTVTVTWNADGEKSCEYNGENVYER
ncbi:MAG: prepilin-type N-terminal cleavage/methylation domain-containing protein [Firmicutes bacterium]|nr:prepilin-type N-terminal cleavage/methylation domain-containing protein [Bacillota bacterium]